MQRVVDTLLRAFASRLSIAGLVALSAGGVLSQPIAAQTSPLSPEVLAMHARLKRPVPSAPDLSDSAAAVSSPNNFNSEQGPGFGPRAGLPGCDVFPAPASTGAKVGLSYFGPSPSTVNPSLVGPVQLLDSGKLDAINGTITLPLYLGHMKGSGKNVWYVLTDVDDSNVAAELGLNFSAKLTFASVGARTANFDDQGNLIFDARHSRFFARSQHCSRTFWSRISSRFRKAGSYR